MTADYNLISSGYGVDSYCNFFNYTLGLYPKNNLVSINNYMHIAKIIDFVNKLIKKMKKINHKLIINFFEDKLREIYLPDEVIKTTIDSLVNASLFGIDSHGVNLFEHYYLCLQNGKIKKGKEIKMDIKGSAIKCNANHNLANFAARKNSPKT